MKSNIKKGFTIVELVIVIAIIAILAGVLIPVFSGIVRNAQTSKDVQLIRNLNTALTVAQVEDGKNTTMYDALQDAKTAGYDISKINANNTQNEILWDSVNDAFVYWNEQNGKIEYAPDQNFATKSSVKGVELFQIVKEMPSNQVCSIYWNSQKDIPSDYELKVGFDAGDCEDVTKINYVGSGKAQNVIIRTNSYQTELTINAERDSIKHYDKLNSVDIEAVSMQSYHEYGDVIGNITLVKGNVVVEQGCSASAVVIDMTASELATVNTISADNTKASYVPIILNTTKEDWQGNEHKELIDPSKNNIIYLVPGSSSTVVKEPGNESADITEAVAYALNANKYYMSVDTAINSALQNETIMILKDNQTYHATASEVNPIAKGVTIDLNNRLLKMGYNAWITGENLTVKNGSLRGEADNQSYCIFFGDEATTSVNLLNLTCVGGFNFYNTTATITACNVRLNENKGYNTIWADENSRVTVESGTFDATNRQNGRGVVGCSNSALIINGGMFLSNNVNLLASDSEYIENEYQSQTNGIFIFGGKYNVNIADFTFLIVKNGEVVEQKEHVSLLREGYKCSKIGDYYVVSEK